MLHSALVLASALILLSAAVLAGMAPPRTDAILRASSASAGATILFGGAGADHLLNDTWAYTYGVVALSVPSAPLGLRAAVGTTSDTQDQVTLTWAPPASTGGYALTAYRIYRGTVSGSEALLTSVSNTQTYLDTAVMTATTYYYQVSAVNGLGEGARSAEVTATPRDLTVPVVVITYPSEGATLTTPSVTVQGTASDDVAVQKVEVSVNNGTWSLASGTASWSAACALQTGNNLILARATDPSGNEGLAGVNVTVGAGAALHVSALANAWTDLAPPVAPSPRVNPLMAYDSRTGRVILFGGRDFGYPGMFNDTWSYDPATNRWTNRTPATHPELGCPSPMCAAMVYDSRADRVILYGASRMLSGNPNETWVYDPNANAWTQMHPASSPGTGHDFGLVYDAAGDRVLLFGGGAIPPHMYDVGSNRTWSYDYATDTWTDRAPATAPSARYGMGMAYDSQADRTILFGGCTRGLELWPFCAETNDTWAYDYQANAWTNRTPASSPSPGKGFAMVYDSQADRIILFGRGRPGGNDTWSYDYATNAWVNQSPSASPPARSGAGLVYVSAEVSGAGGAGGNSVPSTLVVVGIGALAAVAAAAWIVLVWKAPRKHEPKPPR